MGALRTAVRTLARGPTGCQSRGAAVAAGGVTGPAAMISPAPARLCPTDLSDQEHHPMTTAPVTYVTGVDFVAVPAEDFEASVHFYRTVLGLPAGKRWGNMPGAEFQAGNLTLAIMEPTAFGMEFRPHGLPIALQVDDVAAAKAHLEAQGVSFLGDIIDSGVCHQAIFHDPAGNTLDLHHRYAPVES